jgi:hypothetical protein
MSAATRTVSYPHYAWACTSLPSAPAPPHRPSLPPSLVLTPSSLPPLRRAQSVTWSSSWEQSTPSSASSPSPRATTLTTSCTWAPSPPGVSSSSVPLPSLRRMVASILTSAWGYGWIVQELGSTTGQSSLHPASAPGRERPVPPPRRVLVPPGEYPFSSEAQESAGAREEGWVLMRDVRLETHLRDSHPICDLLSLPYS